MGGAGAGTSRRSEVTSVVVLHCLSLLGLPGVSTRGGGIEEVGKREGCVEEEGGAEVGLRISRHMMRVGRQERAWESERRWK